MRASTRKWDVRAQTFLGKRARQGEKAAVDWGHRFRRQAKLIGAIVRAVR